MLAGKPTLTSDPAHIRTDSRTISPAAHSSNVIRDVSGQPGSGPEGVKIYWYAPGESSPGVKVRSSVRRAGSSRGVKSSGAGRNSVKEKGPPSTQYGITLSSPACPDRSWTMISISSCITQLSNWILIRLLSASAGRSEEHTSELQSRGHLVC